MLQSTITTNKIDASKTIKRYQQKSKTENKNPENEPKKTNPNALVSFLIFAYWVVLAIVFLITLGSRGIGILLFLSLFMLIIPFMLLSIFALVKWLKCKDCYKNNGLAIPGLLFMGLVLFSLIYLLVEILIDSF
ncbi:MAG: hypothetical protein HUU48_07670 [Flavobacteriales bacterium]|nr:hypothetical protein [Flavobacteriales bacterium]